MTTAMSLNNFESIGTICLNSATDLVSWARSNGVNISMLEVSQTPRIGFRVGWTNDSHHNDKVVLDVCLPDLDNPQPPGTTETGVNITRFEMRKNQAMALAQLLASAAKVCS